ncbi:sensor histidine kinase [Luteococcus sanguinis]|uniref:Oxygen sensor histidine kinase NreB n=1 Tax=Luteococcus sanguinis TaxID=174038 RepID=A0ABW1X308_9ACTN
MYAHPESAGALVRRAMHAAFVVLLGVGVVVSLSDDHRARVWASAAAVAIVYAGGIGWQASRPSRARDRRAGLVWITALVLVWTIACLSGQGFVWLAFPLFFLALFIVAAPWSLLLVAMMVVWCGALPLLRGGPWTLGALLGPALAALFAVGVHRVVAWLRADALTRASVQERERLASEVHDTIAQGLNAIVLLARQGSADVLPEIERTARENLAVARDIVRAGDEGSTVTDRVRAAAAAAGRQATAMGQPVQVECRVEGVERLLATERAQLLVLAASSLLSNVVRHAAASRCVVTLTHLPDEVTLDVADDGRGFDPATSTGFGLRALRRRVESAGGALSVESEPGAGTTVGLVLPQEAA